MTPTSSLIPSEPFDINKSIADGHPTARFPIPNPGYESFVQSTDAYLMAMRASLGDVARVVESNLAEVAKALNLDVPPQAYSYATMSFMPDPANAGLLPWPGIPPESLRKVARENIAPQLVTRARVTDLARYSGLSTQLWEPGWSVGLRDEKETPSKDDLKDIRDAERFIWNCNRESSYSDARERDAGRISSFEMFLRQFGDDTHTFDGWSVWTDMDRAGRIKAFANLPAGNIRLAIPGKGYANNPQLFCALVDNTGNPVRPFSRDELYWAVRNPRNDPDTWGYGWSEIEISIMMVQAFQSAIQLNSDTFTRNSMPNGMLLAIGDYFNQPQLDALTREFTNMKRGTSKMWGMPVIGIPEKAKLEILNFMDMKGQDIRYKDHINLMGGIYCIVAQFPPRRLGIFASGQKRDNEPLKDESVETAGVDDPGLPALLGFARNRINEYLIAPNWPKLIMRFNGANPKEDARAYEARKMARTWKEARTAVDLPSLSKGMPKEMKVIGDIMDYCPEDPSKAGVYQTLATKWLELEMGGGEEGEGGEDAEKQGAPFPSKRDPAKSESHGHRSGVRRDSAREAASAESDA